MRKRWLILFLLVSAMLIAADEKPAALAFSNVTVVDVKTGELRKEMTVLVVDNRIKTIGATKDVSLPAATRVIDASGKYLIPGLWDMHAHIWNRDIFLPLFIANGITGVREMGGGYGAVVWKKDIAAGKLIGPRLVLSLNIVDGPKPVWQGSTAVKDEADGRKAVQDLRKQGADFIKVYSLLTREGYLGIADEAKKESMPFAGHVPQSIPLSEASDLGQKCVEHMDGLLLACSSQEKELRQELVDAAAKFDVTEVSIVRRRCRVKSMESFSEEKAAKLFEKLAKNQTWMDPTLVVLRATTHINQEEFRKDDRVKYLPVFVTGRWDPKTDFRLKTLTDQDFADMRRVFAREQRLLPAMHKAGVPLLAGTDTPNPFCFPGFSLHDELALLVEGGLSPLAALQTATLNPAKYLDREKELGTIDEGKFADLLLLDANPLEDIKNTSRINAVMVNGRFLDRAALQKMLAEVMERSGNKP